MNTAEKLAGVQVAILNAIARARLTNTEALGVLETAKVHVVTQIQQIHRQAEADRITRI